VASGLAAPAGASAAGASGAASALVAPERPVVDRAPEHIAGHIAGQKGVGAWPSRHVVMG